MTELEPKIRPLVDALNKTGLVRTFSSCEGHYTPEEQTLVDRNHAEVRFVPADGISVAQVEKWLATVLTRFRARHGLIPVNVTAYKLYTPIDEAVEETFVLSPEAIQPVRFPGPKASRYGPGYYASHSDFTIVKGRLINPDVVGSEDFENTYSMFSPQPSG